MYCSSVVSFLLPYYDILILCNIVTIDHLKVENMSKIDKLLSEKEHASRKNNYLT
jgi:hypothetical protein